jgi:hypothetical protein
MVGLRVEGGWAGWPTRWPADRSVTARSTSPVAIDLRELGEHQQARELHEDTLARLRRVLGDGHPDTHRSVRNLAGVLTALGDAERAAVLLAEFGLDP